MRKTILAGRSILSIAAAVFMLLFISTMATAKATSSDAQLKKDIAAINGDAAVSNQQQIVSDRLAKEFKVSTNEITALREKLPNLGEIAAVYAFADKMPGGVTTENVNRVATERLGKKDWDEIAQAHDIKLSSISSKVHGIYKDVHKDIKEASAGKGSRGMGAGGGGY